MLIYLTGIDGSGKSTITKRLQQEIVKGEVETIWARYQPRIVRALIAPFKKNYVKDRQKDFLMDHREYSQWSRYKRKFTKNPVLSKTLYWIQSFDYSMQLKKFKHTLNNHHVRTVIMDRYLLDFIVDQSVNYGDVSQSFITKRYLEQLRKFNYIFFIDTKEEIAFCRKDDIPSIDYLRQRRKYYLEYVSKLENGYIISNNAGIAQAMKEIETILLSNHN